MTFCTILLRVPNVSARMNEFVWPQSLVKWVNAHSWLTGRIGPLFKLKPNPHCQASEPTFIKSLEAQNLAKHRIQILLNRNWSTSRISIKFVCCNWCPTVSSVFSVYQINEIVHVKVGFEPGSTEVGEGEKQKLLQPKFFDELGIHKWVSESILRSCMVCLVYCGWVALSRHYKLYRDPSSDLHRIQPINYNRPISS